MYILVPVGVPSPTPSCCKLPAVEFMNYHPATHPPTQPAALLDFFFFFFFRFHWNLHLDLELELGNSSCIGKRELELELIFNSAIKLRFRLSQPSHEVDSLSLCINGVFTRLFSRSSLEAIQLKKSSSWAVSSPHSIR